MNHGLDAIQKELPHLPDIAFDAAKRIERAIPSETSIGYNGPVDVELLEKLRRQHC